VAQSLLRAAVRLIARWLETLLGLLRLLCAAISGFYEKLRTSALRFEVEDLASWNDMDTTSRGSVVLVSLSYLCLDNSTQYVQL
jgi:hypothetical protein